MGLGRRAGPQTSPSPTGGSRTSDTASTASWCSTQPARWGVPGLHRHSHPLRRAGVLGPRPDAFLLPRRHDGDRRQLRVLHHAPSDPTASSSSAERTLQHVEDIEFDTLAAGVPWGEFETFPGARTAVAARGMALNYGCYVGRTAVRLYVMGEDAYEHAATPDEIARMQAVVADAMAGGTAGFAWAPSPTHNGDSGRPVASRVADLAELRALLEPVKQSGRGVVALLPGGVFPNTEVFRLQREVGRPFTWTALLTVKGYPYHEKVIAEHDAAWAEGVEVWPQVSCRPLVFQMNLSEPFTLNMRPTFAALMGKSKAERVAAYPRPGLACLRLGRRSGKAGGFPLQLGLHLRGRVRARTPSRRSPGGTAGRGARLHAAGRDAGRVARRRPRVALLVRAGQRRPRWHRLVAAAGQRAPRAGGLGSARLTAVRRLLLDRPAGQLGAWARRHAPGAGHPQADG